MGGQEEGRHGGLLDYRAVLREVWPGARDPGDRKISRMTQGDLHFLTAMPVSGGPQMGGMWQK